MFWLLPTNFSAAFSRAVKLSPIVPVVLSKAALTSGAALTKALKTRSLTSLPSAPRSLSAPRLTPNSLAMACATTGAFSRRERNSSPWSLPEPSAWPSWTSVDCTSLAEAPDTFSAFATVSVATAISPCVAPKSLPVRVSRA